MAAKDVIFLPGCAREILSGVNISPTRSRSPRPQGRNVVIEKIVRRASSPRTA